MEYQREFNLQIAHFNNERAYENYSSAVALYDCGDALDWGKSIERLLECLKLIHGHNLKIVVELKGICPKTIQSDDDNWKGIGFLVDDSELSDLVMAWDNTNVSILPEFFGSGKRATTEEMADTLVEKICRKWTNLTYVRVSVWETPFIMSRCERKREHGSSDFSIS